jgi:CheY-like chemotaxis protein
MDSIPANIMLVEDDDVDIMTLQRAFKKNDISNPLHIARDGAEALDMLRGTNGKSKITPTPQIILTDINMPKMNGLELVRALRNDPEFHAISIFVLTTSNDEKDRLLAYELNVAGYIIKPIAMENFIDAVSVLADYWKLISVRDEVGKDVP